MANVSTRSVKDMAKDIVKKGMQSPAVKKLRERAVDDAFKALEKGDK